MFKPYSYVLTSVKESPYDMLNQEVTEYSSNYRKEASK